MPVKMQSDYIQDIQIDPFQLEVEWLRQPNLFMEVSMKASEAKIASEESKARLDRMYAILDQKVRDLPDAFGIQKMTEAVVANTIKTQKEYIEAQEENLKARKQSSMWDALVSALEMKRRALENLVNLYSLQYFCGPEDPRKLTEVKKRMKDIEKQQKERIKTTTAARMKKKAQRSKTSKKGE